MAIHSIKVVQQIPVSLSKAWEFFSDPGNLQTLTPDNIGFTIISRQYEKKMYAGQVIEYKVKPLPGIPLYWMTEIIEVKEGHYFIDEQRKGPYQLWHHQHHFKAVDGGVELTEIIHYKNPGGLLGDFANFLFVKKKLKQIFEFRIRKVEELFGKWDGQKPLLEIK